MKNRLLSMLAFAAVLGAAVPVAEAPAPRDVGPPVLELAAAYGQVVLIGDGEIFIGEPANSTRSGVVYVYRRGGGGAWVEAAQLTAPDAERSDGFGSALALSGSTLLVGGEGSSGDAARVHVFQKQGGDWSHSAQIQPSAAAASPTFGAAVAMAGDLALIGDPGAGDGTGAVYRFSAAGGGWNSAGPLTSPEAGAGGRFGSALAVDDGRLLVGAPGAAGAPGSVHVYERGGDGAWAFASLVAAPGANVTGFGAALYVNGNEAIAVARAGGGGRGGRGGRGGGGAASTVHVLQYSEGGRNSGWNPAGQLMPFDGGAGFGSSMAVTDGEVWVGASGANAIYVFERGDQAGEWAGTYKLSASADNVSGLASALSVVGNTAVAGATGTDRSGSAVVFERGANGDWSEAADVRGPADAIASMTGGEQKCSAEGKIDVFDCGAADLVSFLSVEDLGGTRGESVNDVWGWVDPQTNREYAIVARRNGTSFVDMTDAENPVYIGRLPRTEGSPGSTWRDIKTYQNHAYIVSDAAGQHGMQVFDLTRLRDHGTEEIVFDMDAHYQGIASAHNIVINEETGFAYSVGSGGGGETCGGGLHMIDIRQPKTPTFAGCFSDPLTGRSNTGYSHDAQCFVYRGPDEDYSEHELCVGSNENSMSIADVTDKANPEALSRISYPRFGYVHQGWVSEDHRYFFMGDESDEISEARGDNPFSGTRTLVYDITDLEDPQLVKEFFGTTTASDHNLYVRGDLMFQSNYLAGLRVVDVSDPENPVEVGFFDTVPFSENTPSMSGSWSNFPFFPSGIVIVTSGQQGLFLVRPHRPVS